MKLLFCWFSKDLFNPTFKLVTGHQHTPPTASTFDAKVHPDANDLPGIGAAGMTFFHFNLLTEFIHAPAPPLPLFHALQSLFYL